MRDVVTSDPGYIVVENMDEVECGLRVQCMEMLLWVQLVATTQRDSGQNPGIAELPPRRREDGGGFHSQKAVRGWKVVRGNGYE